jgi:uncharacterized protein (DUF1501 family)
LTKRESNVKRTQWNRRLFLKTTGLGLVALGTGGPPRFLERLVSQAHADSIGRRRRTLVAIFQRGAMDGLMAVPPLEDVGLKELRPRLAMTPHASDERARPLDLGNGFGLHPAFEPLHALYRNHVLALVHGIGSPNNTRSHFDAQDFMETGTPFRKGTDSGWLNRALRLAPDPEPSPFRAVALTGSLPRSLYGNEPALAISDLRQFRLRGRGKTPPTTSAHGFESLYDQTAMDLLRDAGEESFDAMRTLEELDASSYQPAPGADYPDGGLGAALKQMAFLIKSGVGLEVGFAETGGWDTHVGQGTFQGAFANRSRDLARCIAAFWTDIAAHRDDVVLLTMTEFGRTVHENGSGGTDHGRASCSFVLGTRVDGGKVHGSVPRLRRNELEDGRDLPVQIDFRSLFAEVAGRHLGVQQDAALFRGWDGSRYPLLRA